ncbi:MAG: tRNA (adenosine(37)-N6)-dimethylallyltransferase MiaA [Candidatus Pacebacteria bacterium]|nr:tRNA (adenosine(37)-N6)-dimethylallyltransferase MiaA [Candidatus Paceibacterota bacterium]
MRGKILVILGPTASGKSDLTVALAKKFNGEIISADSRQVYKGLDIGSGKITKKEMKGVPHHLLDVVKPQTIFTAAKFQKLANKKIKEILKRGKLPIICGGTGFYIQSVVDGVIFPKIKPDPKLRAHLEAKLPSELFLMLKKMDSVRAKTIDPKNPRRLIRAIEITTLRGSTSNKTGDKPLRGSTSKDFGDKFLQFLQIGIRIDKDVLKKRIEKRFLARVKKGLIAEAKKLYKNGLSYKRFAEIGLAHKYLAQYLRKKISKKEFIKKSIQAEQKYAKQQRTWFRRDKRIKWFGLSDIKAVKNTISNFLL